MYAPVAQLDRVPGFGPGGWGFEPSRAYFLKPSLFNQAWLFYRGNQFLFHLHEPAQTYRYNIGFIIIIIDRAITYHGHRIKVM